MRRWLPAVLLFTLTFDSAVAQGPGPGRLQPPPDHWLTLDSLAHAVGLTAEQRTKVAEPYTALNGVMRDAAAKRAELRHQFHGGAGFQPGMEPTPEQRARMDSVRAQFEAFQTEADEWYQTMRNLLTPEQQAKFDALPKPRVAMRRRPRGN